MVVKDLLLADNQKRRRRLHLCGSLQYNAAMQVFYNLHATCSSCKKNLYCSCIAIVRTAAIQENVRVMLL